MSNLENLLQDEKKEIEYTKPELQVNITRDNLEIELVMHRTSIHTAHPLMEDVLELLSQEGVVIGVDEDQIKQICANPIYNKPIVIGRGDPPKTGKDGFVNYIIQTTRDLRPKIREDGTADFKDFGFLQNVTKGDRLCEIYPPQKGEDGMDVFGTILPGKLGRQARNPAGANTEIVEELDKKVVYAAVSGNVEMKRETVNILDVLRISGNVDNATGHVDFAGDVIIAGDVVSGFKVRSSGSIIVKGSVEGAELDALDDITIGENMNGMGKGVLVAGGSLKCKYIQSCQIRVGGDVYADTLMHCNVECEGSVELSGKRAALIGGHSTIAGHLLAGTIGTSTHIPTSINMCAAGLSKNREALELEAQIKQMDSELGKLVQIMTRYDELNKKGVQLSQEQAKAVLQVKNSYMHISAQRKDSKARLEAIKEEQLRASVENSYIECRNRVHTGTRIALGPLVMQVNESFVFSRIHVAKGEISIVPL